MGSRAGYPGSAQLGRSRSLTSKNPVFLRHILPPAISRDRAFLGLLRLIAAPFSERLRPAKQDVIDELAALSDLPPDRLAQRRHGDLGCDPDRRRGVRRGL